MKNARTCVLERRAEGRVHALAAGPASPSAAASVSSRLHAASSPNSAPAYISIHSA